MSAQPELVTVTIDDRSVQVPKGTGLVETAAAAGIEIPVFCYEPRLGAAVGACRMCLCEVEGMPPKPQAACTLTAQDGMVVKTAQTSPMAAEAQEATLEFILVNHPLDCPVCDKGGECPLQDLTFRYGPGSSRMQFPKRTFEKPIPISPAISLDRERCILCYRCTRFSEGVSEDGQLVAENRGSQTLITTFEDEPYTGAFTGNVTELCPVGALLPTQSRFLIRPWELQAVPSVCGMCPVGCNVSVETREGKVRRIHSRNHPEVDEGWLCDKGRFVYSHIYARDRIVDPMQRAHRRGFGAVSWDEALDEAERLIRAAGTRIVTALSGSETIEQAFALAQLLRRGVGAHSAVLPEEFDESLAAYRLPLSAIADAQAVVVLGDEPVVERAPIVDLWIRQARRNGARILDAADKLDGLDRIVLIDSGDGGERIGRLAAKLGLAGKDGSGAFYLPETANGRGVVDAWAAASDDEPVDPEPIGLLIVSGDEAAANPDVRALAEHAEAVLAITMFQGVVVGWADLVLPGTSYLERDGTYVNLEGRLQRLRRSVIPPAPDELAWISKLAERFGVGISPHPAVVFEELSAKCYGGISYADIGEQARLPARSGVTAPSTTARKAKADNSGGLRLVRYRPLFSGPAVERVPEIQFQRPAAEVELSAKDARKLGIANGDEVVVGSNGSSRELRARLSRTLRPGTVRIAEEHAEGLQPQVEVSKSNA
ncbi:MAG: molybdopterin-dependent oxidoreductase [Thermoleophilia bacterium]